MVARLVIAFTFLAAVVELHAQSTETDWRIALEDYWADIDSAYSDTVHSPLPKEERHGFNGLERFPSDPRYRVIARFEPEEGPIFGMKTSTEREPKYRSVGKLVFKLEGAEHRLTVYKNIDLARLPDYVNFLFVPFTDLTNGEETYGGGRYIDLLGPLSQEVEFDLNRAYNPYCAYGGSYSCPIPPPENHLEIAVRAGVKKYH